MSDEKKNKKTPTISGFSDFNERQISEAGVELEVCEGVLQEVGKVEGNKKVLEAVGGCGGRFG